MIQTIVVYLLLYFIIVFFSFVSEISYKKITNRRYKRLQENIAS